MYTERPSLARAHRGGRSERPRRGIVLVYATVVLVVLLGVACLAVDWGRLQLAKTEAQAAADAAARNGAAGLHNVLAGQSAAEANGTYVATRNSIDGEAITAAECTVEIGRWYPATQTFVAQADPAGADAVRARVRRQFGAGRSPLSFAAIFGRGDVTVTGAAVATVSASQQGFTAPSTGNLWLSGTPDGTVTQNFRPDSASVWDTAGGSGQSPAGITSGAIISPGSTITFDGVTGTAAYVSSSAARDADGDPSMVVCHGGTPSTGYGMFASADNGIANVKAPIGAMVGVFVTDADPAASAAPAPLDFSSAAARDFVSLSPGLKQPFFIGDGRRADGTVQQFVVPAGATRFYVGMMDAWQWNDNKGSFPVTGHVVTAVTTVQ
ncbi:MAG: hypothetical protein JWO31_116 [Phycisphaerales bacterium]|nr:hypothetical protein [Phycisphaerales bacterium]